MAWDQMVTGAVKYETPEDFARNTYESDSTVVIEIFLLSSSVGWSDYISSPIRGNNTGGPFLYHYSLQPPRHAFFSKHQHLEQLSHSLTVGPFLSSETTYFTSW